MAKKTPDRAPRRAVVFLLKILLFVVLFVLFFGIFSIENDQLLAKNRTAAITIDRKSTRLNSSHP